MTTEAPQALEGKVVAGRYEIRARIGAGGWAVVHRGWDKHLERDVAIKIYYRSHDEMRHRFEREWKILLELRHENCALVHDAAHVDGLPCAIMEYLDGRLLKDELGSRWPVDRAIGITLQILAGLAHIHDLGLVHRDVKPNNIMLVKGPRGRELVKIFDLGIAKVLGGLNGKDADIITIDGLGTPSYSSPEQIRNRQIDERSDLYNVGLILYEMLVGNRPFSGTSEELHQKHLHDAPPRLPDSVPDSLRDFVAKLLAKDPAARYRSAQDASRALHQIQAQDAGRSPDQIHAEATVKLTPSDKSVPPRHPHRRVLDQLRELVTGGGNNQLCIPATPGQYFDRVIEELSKSTNRSLITVSADEGSTTDSLLAAVAHVLTDQGMWDRPPVSLSKHTFSNRALVMNIAILVRNVDVALSAQPEPVGRSLITDLCQLGVPVIFTSMYPVRGWYSTRWQVSAPELHDIALESIGSDWEAFVAGYGLDDEVLRDHVERCGRSPELFDALALHRPIDVEQRRRNHAETISMRLASLHEDLAKLAAGDLGGVSDAAPRVLAWVSVLNAAQDTLLDPQMAAYWNGLGATTT